MDVATNDIGAIAKGLLGAVHEVNTDVKTTTSRFRPSIKHQRGVDMGFDVVVADSETWAAW